MLDNSGIGHRKRAQKESPGDASDGLEFDPNSSKCRVNETVHDGNEDDEGKGVDVLHDVVGDSVQLHGSSCTNVSFLSAADAKAVE